jgi:cobalt-zinc-cadmium efflux system outer membrane protein
VARLFEMVLAVGVVGVPLGCASDTERDLAPFDRKLSALDLPPAPEERAGGEARRAVEGRRGRLAQGLTLEEAQAIALEANPALLANADGVEAAKARISEAAAFTNPVFGVGKGDFPLRNGPISSDTQSSVRSYDLKAAQTFFSIQKDFDVSGKRVSRVDNAIENERQSEAQYVSAALSLKAQVRVAYANVLVADRNVELAKEAHVMAKRNLDIVSRRAAGGNALPADALRAEADAAKADNDVALAERDGGRARRGLVSLLGDPEATLGPLRGELPLSKLPVDLDDARLAAEGFERNADVIAAKRGVRAAEANLRLQKRTTVPDVTLQAQWNRYILDDNDTLSFNLSVPLPVFDQNRGQIAEAQALLHQAEKQEQAAEQAAIQGVRDDLAVLRTSRARIDRLEREILPKDRKAVELTETAFEGGKVLYLDVIAARQTFNSARSDYVNELSSYEATLADLERVIGRSIEARTP